MVQPLKTKRQYPIKCPHCNEVRFVPYKYNWAITKGKMSTVCFTCSRFKKGQTNSGGFKKRKPPWNKGTGKATYWERFKSSWEWKELKQKVMARDNYTCQICGSKEKVEVDHIKPKVVFPELALTLENVRVLCRGCHIKTDTHGRKALKYKKYD